MPISSMQLLLDLLEAKALTFTRATLSSFHGSSGEELIQSGMLVPNGYERAVTADDDDEQRPMAVEFDERHVGPGYHSPAQGWVSVQQKDLQLYRLDVDCLFRALLGDNLRRPARGIIEVEAGFVWEIGSALVTRTKSSAIWFARRLRSRDDSDRLIEACHRRPSPGLRLVLTSTPYVRLPATPVPGACIISIGDVLSATNSAAIDFEILKARFGGTPTDAIGTPLHLSADGKTLAIHGQTVFRFRGEIQMGIIRSLAEGHRKHRPVPTAELLEHSGSDSLDQAFGGRWKQLKPFLKSENGCWSFEL
jgi:hypothetical protein